MNTTQSGKDSPAVEQMDLLSTVLDSAARAGLKPLAQVVAAHIVAAAVRGDDGWMASLSVAALCTKLDRDKRWVQKAIQQLVSSGLMRYQPGGGAIGTASARATRSSTGAPAWNQLCLQLAHRTVRPSAPMAESGTR